MGNIGSTAIVGAGLPIAVGAVMAFRMRGEDRVALTFFGDGATNIGTFHEALNMASVWKAPVVFIIENNLYGEYSPVRDTTPLDDLARRADPYGIPAVIVDGQDVDAVRDAVGTAVARARAGDGPSLLEMVLDAEFLGIVAAFLDPLVVDEETLGLDAIREVGPGGHFFGAAHTQSSFRTAFHRPMISDQRNYESWQEAGIPEAAGKANHLYHELLAAHQPPALHPAITEELAGFVAHRKAEGGVSTDY